MTRGFPFDRAGPVAPVSVTRGASGADRGWPAA